MTNDQKLVQLTTRLALLMNGRGDRNIKSGGVVRKVKRQIRNLEKTIG